MIIALCSAVFILAYLVITLEHKWGIHKAITAAALGSSLWVILAVAAVNNSKHALESLGSEIFGLFMFLLAAMTIVEVLVHYRFFDLIRVKLLKLNFDDRGQAVVLGVISFFLSAIIDNLTTTIVMIQIARRFFSGVNMLIMASLIVIAANAGGAFSPIGDITTIMLWLANKFTEWEVIRYGFLPSLAIIAVSGGMLIRRIITDTRDAEEEQISLSMSEYVVIICSLLSFFLPFCAKKVGLEPYMGLLFGLGATGCLIALLRMTSGHETHLDADIEEMLKKVDFASIVFFGGILLAVGALRHIGILQTVSEGLFGDNATTARYVVGNTVLGALSAIVDNIPLTAAAINILGTSDPEIWTLLAITVGTGGSMLVIGSAAGVVAMGMVKELTFYKYIEIATKPAAYGYVAGIGVWCLQRLLL